MSLPEILLWQEVRSLGNPFRLRRQVPIAGSTVDFACHGARIVFEVDGAAFHDPEKDRRRDLILTAEGYRVCRIPAQDVLRDPESVALWVIGVSREALELEESQSQGPSPSWGRWSREGPDGGRSDR